jgi:hypothetical protein
MRNYPWIVIILFVQSASFCICAPGATCKNATNSTAPSDLVARDPAVDHYIFDPVLKRSWVVMTDCLHPAWPAHAIETQMNRGEMERLLVAPAKADGSQISAPIVASGSRIEVWRDGGARIRLSGIALESAAVGQPIRVRAGLGSTPLRGIVRGPRSVELTEDSRLESAP